MADSESYRSGSRVKTLGEILKYLLWSRLELPQVTSGWSVIPSNVTVKGSSDDNIYSSLVGIPVASNISDFDDSVTGSTNDINATFYMETMYMYLSCANLSRDDVPTAIDLRQGKTTSLLMEFDVDGHCGYRCDFEV